MKIGILEAGLLRDEMVGRFDPYPVMFERFIGLAGHEFEFETFCVLNNEMPPSIYACDGWLITGSRHGVYDQLEWMAPLQDFVRELAAEKIPLIGVCFGHQIIAQALGGEVVKSDKGWGVGLHRYDLEKTYPWMKTDSQQASMYVFHQDQVVKCPASAEVFLSSEFCPYAGLAYGDSIISVQAHPEFEAAYESALRNCWPAGSPTFSACINTECQTINASWRSNTAIIPGRIDQDWARTGLSSCSMRNSSKSARAIGLPK
jgi:GMP synthase-like glutamine amidotransferase